MMETRRRSHEMPLQTPQYPGFTVKEIACVSRMREAIEAMSDELPRFSDMAYTPNGTVHVILCNGFVKPEGEPCASVDGGVFVSQVTASAIKTCRYLRGQIRGPAVLWWRILPRLEWHMCGGRWTNHRPHRLLGAKPVPQLYMRLCFEAAT